MQLLKITRIPIEYKLEIDRPRLEVKQADNPNYDVSVQPSKMDIETQNIKVRLDTTEMRSSLGLKSAPRLISEASDRGAQAAKDATASYAEFGNQLAQIHHNVDVANIILNRMLEQPDSYTAFLPTTGPEISWEPAQISMNYQAASQKFDWNVHKNVMDYVPGKFRMNIVQYPRVKIEYLGEPSYVPPSANPNYAEEE